MTTKKLKQIWLTPICLIRWTHYSAHFYEFGNLRRLRLVQMSSIGSLEMKYCPVEVSFVAFVIIVFPNFNAPLSTTPPPGLGSL